MVGIPALCVLFQGRIRELLKLEAQQRFLGRSNGRRFAFPRLGSKRATGLALAQPALDAPQTGPAHNTCPLFGKLFFHISSGEEAHQNA